MTTSRGTCEFCNRDVTSLERAAHRIRGWELEREGGGANQIAGRERQRGRIAHASCVQAAVEAERHGIAAGQQSLT